MSKLIVGLGNPGREYEQTRHNIGFLTLDFLVNKLGGTWVQKFKGEYCKINIANEDVHFLKPLTFMNLSGESVSKLITFFKISPKDLFVIHDELDLKFRTIVMKSGGGLAGHNGLKSINQSLGTKDFFRLRMGIGRPEFGDVSSYVLSKFSEDQRMFLDDLIQGSSEAVKEIIIEGFEKSLKKYAKKIQI